ncbi:ABC transporter ATP-binding protein [Rufibacter roseus]|uniref:ABC transporter ATP-binding protein n=1 Tax=Rufibacter roseus TaxID=1567108 RepID=A0ABW2DI95_9BACT|nr:ABC transporter ATP-binding protein [Rufibacter roseus]
MELVIQNLSKTYPNGVQALKNVNLTIPTGMFGLLGPNGAGKSSLMRTIATLQEADSGSIRLGDLDVFKEKDEMRRVLGYLPQEFGVYPKVSAEELLDHFAVLKGIHNSKERKETVAALLQQTNLYEVRKKNLGGYSGGMKQRFGIAQALLGNPKIIIVDEPTAGLDPAERNRFHNLLSEIGENIIVILSTHIVDDVSDLCRNMAIINKGEVLLTGEPLQAIDEMQGQIWRKFIKKEELAQHQAEHTVISSRLYAGKTIIHVYAQDRPDIAFEQVQPDLEDVYFATISGATKKPQRTQAEPEVMA